MSGWLLVHSVAAVSCVGWSGVDGPSRAEVDVAPAWLVAGSTATLTCTTDAANPAARLTWWTASDDDGRLEVPLDAAAVRETRTTSEQGGVVVVVSRVELRLNADDDRRIVVCRANGTRTATGRVQLRVHCKSR